MTRIGSSTLLALVVVLLAAISGTAFVTPSRASLKTTTRSSSMTTTTVVSARKKEDLSYLETRDMTKEEMLELNKKNEEIMNMELSMMTGFSLVISLPILYLCWVAFFSD